MVLGGLNVDLVVHVPRLPGPGETVAGRDLLQFPGGKGANQAVAAARAGADVAMIGCAGNDAFGESLLAGLTREGIDTRHVRRDPAPSGVALIFVDPAAQNTIAVAPGANMRVGVTDVEAAAEAIAAAEVLLLPLETPPETVARAVALAARAGTRVVLNPAPAAPLPADLLAAVDYLVPNERELITLVAGDGPPGRDAPATGAGELALGTTGVLGLGAAEAAGRRLLARGARRVIVTLAERGSLLLGPGVAHHCPAFAVEAVDTTAAGDAYCGAFAAAISESQEERAAMRFASAAAALAVTQAGAQPSLPARAAIERLLAAN